MQTIFCKKFSQKEIVRAYPRTFSPAHATVMILFGIEMSHLLRQFLPLTIFYEAYIYSKGAYIQHFTGLQHFSKCANLKIILNSHFSFKLAWKI